MKSARRLFLIMLTIVSVNSYAASSCCETDTTCSDTDRVFGKTFYNPRPASVDTSRKLVGTDNLWFCSTPDCTWWTIVSVALGYQRTAAKSGMGQYFAFGNGVTKFSADTTTAYFAGTNDEILVDTSSNVRSTDFGLSQSFVSTIEFRPEIRQFVADLDILIGLDSCLCGLYFRLGAPLINAKYKLNATEDAGITSTQAFPAGFVTNTSSTVAAAYDSAIPAWQELGPFGDTVASSCGLLPGSCSDSSSTRIGAINLELGLDVIHCDWLNLGIALYGVVGTGTSPCSNILFPAVAGSPNSQFGFAGHLAWNWWSCGDSSVTLYNETTVTHVFSDCQERIAGLSLGGTTRGNSWVLLKEFDGNGAYTGTTTRAIDKLCRSMSVSNNVMLDTSFMLNWQYCSLDIGLGYNFWYRSKDKVSCDCSCDSEFADGRFGIKGVAPDGNGSGTINSTYYSKTDSSIKASGTLLNGTDSSGMVSESDVCLDVALAPHAYTNKIFGYVGHRWDYDCLLPFVGIQGFYEWGHKNESANQWGFLAKVGAEFDCGKCYCEENAETAHEKTLQRQRDMRETEERRVERKKESERKAKQRAEADRVAKKEAAEQRERDKKESERKAKQRAEAGREAKKRAAEQREQNKKESDRKAIAKKKAQEERAQERAEVNRKAAEQKAAKQVADKKAAERKAVEAKKVAERKATEQKEAAEKRAKEREATRQKAAEQKAAKAAEVAKKKAEDQIKVLKKNIEDLEKASPANKIKELQKNIKGLEKKTVKKSTRKKK